jgi:non-homologous end joining protein Ku
MRVIWGADPASTNFSMFITDELSTLTLSKSSLLSSTYVARVVGKDVYAVLYEVIEDTGRVALSRVVIARRERTIALRPRVRGSRMRKPRSRIAAMSSI